MGFTFGDVTMEDSLLLYSDQRYVRIAWEAADAYLASLNREMDQAVSLFVEGDVTEPQEYYQLPGYGRLQRIGPDGRPLARKRISQWDAGYPIELLGDMIEANMHAQAFMTAGEFRRHVDGVVNANSETIRQMILSALLDWNTYVFDDPIYSTINVRPLANSANASDTTGAARLYPPVVNSGTVDATANHYLVSGYATSSISDSNNPIATIARKLNVRYGTKTGGSNIAVFYNYAERAKLHALTEFVEIPDYAIELGDDSDETPISRLPEKLFRPGVTWTVTGRFKDSGAWAVEWDRIPATYMIGVHLDAPAPLKRRVYRKEQQAILGGPGLRLAVKEQDWPHVRWIWTHNTGYGVGNALGAVVLQTKTGADADYDVPSGFARAG